MATSHSEQELTELGRELVADHRAVEELAEILSVTGKDRTDYSDRIKAAVLDSLLVRTRSLLDFYWLDRLQPRLFKRRLIQDAFASDFFVANDKERGRWEAERAPAADLVRPWLLGRQRVNSEFMHLSYRRSRPPALPRGERWWTPEYPWALVVLSGSAFEEALTAEVFGDLRERLHEPWRPFFAERSVLEIVEHVQLFVVGGSFTGDFAGPRGPQSPR